jgi:hypothetical protein
VGAPPAKKFTQTNQPEISVSLKLLTIFLNRFEPARLGRLHRSEEFTLHCMYSPWYSSAMFCVFIAKGSYSIVDALNQRLSIGVSTNTSAKVMLADPLP